MCNDKCDCNPAEQLAKDEKEELFKNNKYLSEKSAYDYAEILVDGKIPEFKTAAEEFDCAIRLAYFVRRNGICKQEHNLAKFLKAVDAGPRTHFLKQQTLETLEYMAKHKEFQNLFTYYVDLKEHE